ncbi:hypothetical protein MAR_024847 [Mya arenaria]|uniref:Uncharacterized protein n=1 Tax=Mya arenaria TaxID=6604 RepID=A0ABY7DV12_MYAAR|nr:hypothetical protein MAR_024847 [Mya arenaria]
MEGKSVVLIKLSSFSARIQQHKTLKVYLTVNPTLMSTWLSSIQTLSVNV